MTNFLQPNGFRFNCEFLPSMSDFVQRAALPGLGIAETKVSNPFVPVNVAGDKIDFYTFQIEFKVREDMQNWTEAVDWLKATGFDNDYSQHANWIREKGKIKSEASVVVLNSYFNEIITVTYEDIAPVFVGGFTLQTDSTDIPYVSSVVDFSYTKWKYKRPSQ